MTDLLVIVPTRSRPEAVPRVVKAWEETAAFEDGGELLFVIDYDDPECDAYEDALAALPLHPAKIHYRSIPQWRPLVPKLNEAAITRVTYWPEIFAVGFAGDDHLPRTPHWAARYLETLAAPHAGIVYCDDGYQHENIPTQWAMRADLVRALGAMVPAAVEHLYCDNVIRDLGRAAACLDYLPDVLIEHMHPVAGKAPNDEQYQRVNSRQQYRGDRHAYRLWRDTELATQAARVRDTIRGRTEA